MKAKSIDWEKIEIEFRSGQLSIREIARQYDCAESGIRAKAKKDGWTRDLTDKVRQRVRDKLLRSEVRAPNAHEDEIIEESAERGAQVLRLQRKDIGFARETVAILTQQLSQFAGCRDELEQDIEVETDNEKGVQRRNRMLKAVSLPAHAAALRDLSTALKSLVPLERQAFSLDDKPVGGKNSKAIKDDSDPFVLFPSAPMTIAEWEAQCAEADEARAKRDAEKNSDTDSDGDSVDTTARSAS